MTSSRVFCRCGVIIPSTIKIMYFIHVYLPLLPPTPLLNQKQKPTQHIIQNQMQHKISKFNIQSNLQLNRRIMQQILLLNTNKMINENILIANTKTIFTNRPRWTLYLRSPNPTYDLSNAISRVIFQLHPSFAQPTRELTKPPFEVTETGWGEFEASIRIVWREGVADERCTMVRKMRISVYSV